jgi:hypothetical protein
LQPGAPKRPSYLVVDKACGLLRHLVTSGAWLIWMVTTRFKVDRFHWRNHSQRDALCQQWCNMAPTDGSDPNLVRRVMVNGTERHIGQFNSEVNPRSRRDSDSGRCALGPRTAQRLARWLRASLQAHGTSILLMVRSRPAAPPTGQDGERPGRQLSTRWIARWRR